MACENCKNNCEKKQMKCIPYAVYELDMAIAERKHKRLFASLVFSLVATVVSVILGAIF